MKVNIIYIEGRKIANYEVVMDKTEENDVFTVSIYANTEDDVKLCATTEIKRPPLHPHLPHILTNMMLATIADSIDFPGIKIIDIDYPEKRFDFNAQGHLVEIKSENDRELQAELGGS